MQESTKATYFEWVANGHNTMWLRTQTHARISPLLFGDADNLPMIHSIGKFVNENGSGPSPPPKWKWIIDTLISGTIIDKIVYVFVNISMQRECVRVKEKKWDWIFYLAIDVFMTHDNTCFMCPSRSMHVRLIFDSVRKLANKHKWWLAEHFCWNCKQLILTFL